MPEVKCAHDEMVPLEKLVPNPRNPNEHPVKQIKLLAKIIENTGWRTPITVSNRSGFIVRGHGRYEAAKLLKCNAAPVDFQDYANEAEEWADLIADNRIAELAEMDRNELASLLKEIEAMEFDFALTGFSISEFEKLIEDTSRELEEKPEVEFTRELLLEHNYIVLYFDNPLDWQVALEKFKLKKVKDLIPRKEQPTGIGRVLPGKDWLDRIN